MTKVMTEQVPHVPAAFINALAEEGTKAEAVAYLQKEWNENCALKARIQVLTEVLRFIVDGGERTDINHRDYRIKVHKVALAALNPEKANG